MRTFTLINNDGTEYDLTAKGSAFFHTIDGLGYDRVMDFQQVDSNFWLLQDKISQNIITGTVKFFGSTAPADYFSFANFCENKPLRMKYNAGHGEYYRRGYVKSLKRGDGSGNITSATVEFYCTSPWYKIVTQYNDGTITDGKAYDYEYDYQYTESTPGSLTLVSSSWIDCPAKLIIYGPVENPVWKHYVDGDLVTSGAVTGTIAVNRRLVIDTTSMPWSIQQLDALGNVVSDMYQLSDFSTDRFVRLEHGTNVISVTDDSASTVTLAVEAMIEYDTI